MNRHPLRAGWFARFEFPFVLCLASLVLGGCGSGESPTSGPGGAGGGATTTGGQGGSGGEDGLDVCVLNQGIPEDPCATPEKLDYGAVPAGSQAMRLFRIDNTSGEDAVFKSVKVSSPDFSVVTVRYDPDPKDPGVLVRSLQTLPVTRPTGKAVYFEVTFTSTGVAGSLAPNAVHVDAGPVGSPSADIAVPILGTAEGCPPGKGACDADPRNGCETDIGADPLNCGGCNAPCAPANSTGVCQGGVCVVSACTAPFADCNKIAADGCEADLVNGVKSCGSCDIDCSKANTTSTCSGGACKIEACAPGFADCNLLPGDGCEQDTATSLENCGGCNVPCALANAAESCAGGLCLLGACDPGFTDCDKDAKTGCEADLTTDIQHCGSCGNDCTAAVPNVAATCGSGGVCSYGGCLPGHVDLDGSLANGCEYACTFVSAADLPDDNFVDANCDGIDGDITQAIFVATTGNDANPGTMAAPALTVNGGIAKALSAGKSQVYISQGIYDGRVMLANGVSLHGGYAQSNGWARSAAYVATLQSGAIISGHVSAVEGLNINSPTVVDRLTIQTMDTSAVEVSNYALECQKCPALTLTNSTLVAGSAGPGVAGLDGTPGAAGGNATPGGIGVCIDKSVGGAGGIAGTSPCGRNGGAGGKGGDINGINGIGGDPGVGPTAPGLGGPGGSIGASGGNGNNGLIGSAGANGPGGGGGVITAGFWTATTGITGAVGNNGNGASGGGGGGASTNGAGNGGGGGGGGGCGGTGATGGTGGGGSFGLFLVSSTGFVMNNNNIASSSAGNGGAGGVGGSGGSGGGGGLGGKVCTNEVGAGGYGGNGGAGGRGGHGGGGAGGASYAVFQVVTMVSGVNNILVGGTGGLGGVSIGNDGAVGGSGAVY
jgi:hypothetical protein